MGELKSISSLRLHRGRAVTSHGGFLRCILLVLFAFVGHGSCADWFYEGTDIIEIDAKSLKERVVTTEDEVWMVEWFHPGCGHCVNFKKSFIKAVSLVPNGTVLFGAIDCSKDFSTADEYGVHSLPSMKFFGPNEHKGEMYLGGHDPQEIADAALLYLKTNGTKQYEGNWAFGKAQLSRARFTLHAWGISDFLLSFSLVFSIGSLVLFRHKVVESWPGLKRLFARRSSLGRGGWSSHCA